MTELVDVTDQGYSEKLRGLVVIGAGGMATNIVDLFNLEDQVLHYYDNMADLLNAADLVVGRSGAVSAIRLLISCKALESYQPPVEPERLSCRCQ